YALQYGSSNLPELTVSSGSGFPIASKIKTISLMQKDAGKKIPKLREVEQIVDELIFSLYENEKESVNIFANELQSTLLYSKLDGIVNFNDVFEVSQGNAPAPKTRLATIQHAAYPLDEMSCASLYIELYHPKKLTSKLPRRTIQQANTNSLDIIYQKLIDKKTYPFVIRKTSTEFFFEGRGERNREWDYLVREGPILEMKVETLENWEVMTAESPKELKEESVLENTLESKKLIYICNKKQEDKINQQLISKGQEGRVYVR
ncbi:MAG: hypothetical protein KC535_05505, partial [Nanoarchaeota archaeon]|nr:hypothetical protein [Nanoarchaeota archaeon]